MTLGKPPICLSCKRLSFAFEQGQQAAVCTAFPDGIPDRILRDGYDHRLPFPGDGGQHFVRNPDEPLPPGFPEETPTQQPIRLADPGEIRTQNAKALRETAKRLIGDLRQHSRDDGAF